MDNEPIVHFRRWAHSVQKTGVNGDNKNCPYVPPSRLKEYWTEETVQEVLDACHLRENVAKIMKSFPRVFSTLVYAGQPEKINLFIRRNTDDVHLPMFGLPPEWPPVLRKFLHDQWMFCPLEFSDDLMFKRELPIRQILPVTYLESLRNKSWCGDGPSIQKVEIHPECNAMTAKDTHVVFKTFKGPGMKRLYKAEAEIYSKLSSMPKTQKNITKHYGSFSFEQTDTQIIIIEYAAQGSLLDFFRETSPPDTPEEFLMFWRELLKLVPALHAFQTFNRSPLEGSSRNGFTMAVHQDIQPANILVFPHPPKSPPRDKSRFDVRFKLADFGLAELRRVSKPDEQFTIENEGNCMYGAPECYSNRAVEREVRPAVTAKVDVWSVGAVLSDALVWSKSGEPGREEYRTCRSDAITKLGHIKARGFEACFHDGEHVLDVVPQFHSKILHDDIGSDNISERMSGRVCANILIRHADKVMDREALVDPSQLSQIPPPHDPGQVPASSEDQAVNPQRQSSYPRALTPQTSPTVPSDRTNGQSLTHMSGPRARVPVERIYDVLEKKEGRLLCCRLKFLSRRPERVIEVPGLASARSKIKDSRGRVQILVIDNFTSMKPHMRQVAKTARVISYYIKVANRNRMALFFASDPTRSWKCSTSTQVESAIQRMKSVDGRCSMKICLLNIIEKVLKSGKNGIKPTSIYVYTDGVWEGVNDVKSVIQKSIGRLAEGKEDPSRIMFQFIQYGNDDQGTARLRELDDKCKEHHHGVE
ncbi:hypothetical protein NW757_010629 [Fusarium falciforme]|nr:hypothetical protein NW757_010629 [Fusarium falciforme]